VRVVHAAERSLRSGGALQPVETPVAMLVAP
jgi:hypothetical protein